jgi:hypothetical protein
MTFEIEGQPYRVTEHILREHPNRADYVTVERIRETILTPERTELGKVDRIIYWRWFPELSNQGNYLKVIIDPLYEPHIVVTAMPDRNERRRRRRLP